MCVCEEQLRQHRSIWVGWSANNRTSKLSGSFQGENKQWQISSTVLSRTIPLCVTEKVDSSSSVCPYLGDDDDDEVRLKKAVDSQPALIAEVDRRYYSYCYY